MQDRAGVDREIPDRTVGSQRDQDPMRGVAQPGEPGRIGQDVGGGCPDAGGGPDRAAEAARGRHRRVARREGVAEDEQPVAGKVTDRLTGRRASQAALAAAPARAWVSRDAYAPDCVPVSAWA